MGDDHRPRGSHRACRRSRRAPIACAFGALVLLAVLGGGGPGAPVTTVTALPPPDTTAFGATGRLPDPTPVPLPDAPAGALPGDPGLGPTVTGSGLGIPETVLAAYRSAATTVDRSAPGCRLTWPLVAGIGKIESGHASGGAVDGDGTTLRPILGPRLTGTGGNAAIPDTDGGRLDHDAVWDRAVGPTQFIPSSWRTYGADGNGDGRADPDNVFDAGLATARYLCAGGGDLTSASARHDAVFRYNHSEAYVATVLRWADAYASGALPVPDSTTPTETGETLADGAPTLAALPEPATAGAGLVVPGAGPGAPVITSSGATRPGTIATRSPGSDLVAGAPAATAPTTTGAGPTTTGAAPLAVGRPAPGSPLSSTSTTPGTTTVPVTTTPGTTAAGTGPPSTRPSSSRPAPTKPAPVAASSPTRPAPAPSVPAPAAAPSSTTPRQPAPTTTTPTTPPTTTPPTTTPPTTTPPTTTPPTTTPPTTTPAARCTAAVPVVARALGVPAAQVTASSEAGPGAGRTTCTVRGPHGPLLVAVTADTGAPAPPTPATGVGRAVAGGRTVLTVPPTAGVAADRARTALATIGTAWS
ncbi:lytic transglycosylase domain-containing protein [Actinomycetospora endophytica]|uniref:Lytic transglycosylase domain-containing protein n=1 Tax=Actinomycetospora endophytica TaxID=2291215 RepID=A0ABS8PGU5_9PSEU|nr:lytic murein transglycosylase [Actinomycetospora endophytica]MCD2197491.1 lytic transglycosylase domain-containing protein [Actinomycetospora endophytica]